MTDTRRAKRLFPLFGSGAILGAVVGGIVTRPLAGAVGVGNLLFAWAACLVGAAALCTAVLGVPRRRRARRAPARRPTSALHDIVGGLSFVRRSPLLVWMTAAGVLFSVMFYSLFLPFAQAATVRYPDPKELAGFFGVFGAGVTVVALVISILLTNRLLGWLGAAAIVLVLPVLYAGSFGVLVASSSFTMLVAVRAGVNVWLQGVTAPAWETLVNVVPETRRDQVRAFLSGGPSQTGTAIAGLVTLVGQQAMTARRLSLIGLSVAAITIAVAWRIRRSYTGALVDALRAGRPSVFEGRAVEGIPVVLERDGQAVGLALEASRDGDPRIRRLAVELLSAGGDDARVRSALVERAGDEDAIVRAHAIRGLGRAGALDAFVLGRALEDHDGPVRLSAVEALGEWWGDPEIADRLLRVEEDTDPSVAAALFVSLLGGPSRGRGVDGLQRLLSAEDEELRLAALRRVRAGTPEDILTFARPMLDDPSSIVRSEALRALAASAPGAAIQPALEALGADDASMREAAFDVLGTMDLLEHGTALVRLAQARGSRAQHDLQLAGAIPPRGEAEELLRTALMERGRSAAFVTLSALSLVSRDGDAMRTALDNLQGTEPTQIANALETLETTEFRTLIGPLFPLWEPTHRSNAPRDDWFEIVSEDPDPLIRSCVALVRTTERRGDDMSRSRISMSAMERVLALRKIPLFAELSTADLRRVADIAEERAFAGGDVISSEGETGDELHLVLDGTVVVTRGGTGANSALARRGPGEVVGEMSILTRSPRVASLVAEGDVRTLRIGQREFESMIRERPDLSLALLRVLAERLGAETRDRTSPTRPAR